ncbi:MAG: UDP-N-acetylmuramoyl-L-alanine--D-glutamate ligase [Planctomycetes bacterium]|nr:UDP-N-acetylmuramoyl-L-alanine--D-glutamate ligase [Planctomycetota bacterium]
MNTPAKNANAPLPEPGAMVLVHGLGRFGGGREAVRFLARSGYRVRIADRSAGADLQAVSTALADLRELDWQLGREDESLLDGIALMVANPGVPDDNPLLQAARRRGLPITQEVDLFLGAYPGRVVAVTGTNGKSTTSTLLHRALQQCGVPALLGGNIGHSLLADVAQWRADQIAVLEISSFQLERLGPDRSVHGAVFTRIGKDHIDRHGSLQAYQQAKARLAAVARGFVVHAAEDPVASDYPSPAALRLRYTATAAPAPHSGGVIDGYLALRTDRGPAEPLVHQDALRLLGAFQVENALAAGLAARLCGGTPHGIGLALASAMPLPFRLQLVANHGGVSIYDNGVSTEIESTRSALASLRGRVHWLGGGKSKDGDYATVAAAVRERVASAHLFGAAAAPLAQALAGAVPTTVATTLREALRHALAAAAPGDAILWSPAFASFDQYPNFRARALEFHALLAELRADATTAR